MSGRVLVVGSYNTDLVTFGAIPRIGETVLVDRFESMSGGKGSNQAIAAARLGATVKLCARVGADSHGDDARSLLAREGICADAIIVDERAPTGVAIVMVDANGDNAIAVAPGANGELVSQDLAQREALFAEATVVLLQLETPIPTVRTALELSQRNGCLSVLDPAPAAPLPDDLLALVDVLTPNQSEATYLVGSDVVDTDTAVAAAQRLRARGCTRALITLGAQGCVFVDPDGVNHISAPAVSVLDTTGAGDAFNGGFAAALASGSDWLPAARFATRVAAASVQREGVLRSLPHSGDLADIPEPRVNRF